MFGRQSLPGIRCRNTLRLSAPRRVSLLQRLIRLTNWNAQVYSGRPRFQHRTLRPIYPLIIPTCFFTPAWCSGARINAILARSRMMPRWRSHGKRSIKSPRHRRWRKSKGGNHNRQIGALSQKHRYHLRGRRPCLTPRSFCVQVLTPKAARF